MRHPPDQQGICASLTKGLGLLCLYVPTDILKAIWKLRSLTPMAGGKMRLPTEALSCSTAADAAALLVLSRGCTGLIRM